MKWNTTVGSVPKSNNKNYTEKQRQIDADNTHIDNQKSFSYLDLNLDIDNKGWQKDSIYYDKRFDYSFPVVNFPFIYSKFTAAETYGVYMYHADILEPVFSYLNILDNVLATQMWISDCEIWLSCPNILWSLSWIGWSIRSFYLKGDRRSAHIVIKSSQPLYFTGKIVYMYLYATFIL